MFFIFCAFALISVSVTWLTFQEAIQSELRKDQAAGQVRLTHVTSRFQGQFQQYRWFVNAISRDYRVVRGARSEELEDISLRFGATAIDLTNTQGDIVQSSDPKRIGIKHQRPLISAARNGRLGFEISVSNDNRVARFSRWLMRDNKIAQIIVVSISIASLEFEWPVTPEPIVFFDYADRVVASNRPEFLLLRRDSAETADRFPLSASKQIGDITLWRHEAENRASSQENWVQLVTQDSAVLQMQSAILLPIQRAYDGARLRAALVATLFAALGLAGGFFWQQRRRLRFESHYSATLEQRVSVRTKELEKTQRALIEASNLAALGRLAGGITHELNQPLSAILNFSENGRRFIETGRGDEAQENFALISDQLRRITRIIKNLRAFARDEDMPTDRVDLCKILQNAIALAQTDIDNSGTKLTLDLPVHPLWIIGGEIRLEQVIFNLISNSLDAMQSVQSRQIDIQLFKDGDVAKLHIGDNGTGIKDPDRVFEPFYSTKELGASKGLGMGLALAFGTITRLGGTLSCENQQQGAKFMLSLPVPTEDQ